MLALSASLEHRWRARRQPIKDGEAMSPKNSGPVVLGISHTQTLGVISDMECRVRHHNSTHLLVKETRERYSELSYRQFNLWRRVSTSV